MFSLHTIRTFISNDNVIQHGLSDNVTTVSVLTHLRVWIKRGDAFLYFHVLVMCGSVYTFHFPSVALCKGQAVHEIFLLFFRYFDLNFLD